MHQELRPVHRQRFPALRVFFLNQPEDLLQLLQRFLARVHQRMAAADRRDLCEPLEACHMIDRYEQLVTLRYLENLMRSGAHAERYRAIRVSLGESGEDLGVALPAALSPAQLNEEIGALDARWEDLRALIQRRLLELRGTRPDRLERNLRAITAALELNARDRALLGLLVRQRIGGVIDRLFDALGAGPEHSMGRLYTALQALLGFSRADVIQRLQSSAPLLAGGLVQRSGGEIRVLGRLMWAVQTASIARADATEHLLGKPLGADLRWEDFDHVAIEAV